MVPTLKWMIFLFIGAANAESFAQIHDAADCCRNNGARVGKIEDGGAKSPADCEGACLEIPSCAFFSHSTTWNNCNLCSECDFTTTGNAARYTSWERVTTPEPTSGSAHQVAQGRTSWGGWGSAADSYCQSDTNNQAEYPSSKHSYNIGVGCCSIDGTKGYRPDCSAHPATYDEAVAVCSSRGYRLCTLQEMLSGKSNGKGITEGTGCWYDAAYQWTSDECGVGTEEPATPTSDPSVDPTSAPTVGPTRPFTADLFIIGDESLTWTEAKEWCQERGYELASIHSEEQNSMAAQLGKNLDVDMWIGGSSPSEDNAHWEWLDGTEWSFTKWNPGEPNNRNEHCLQLYQNGNWNNLPCGNTHRPLCRNNLFVIGSESMSWVNAHKWCQAQGHELAAIHSAEENKLAAQVASGHDSPWIGGLNPSGDNDHWEWSSGSAWNYENWFVPSDEPSHAQELCVHLYSDSGYWNDNTCSKSFPPLCRTDPDSSGESAHKVAQGLTNWVGWGSAPDSYCQSDANDQSVYRGLPDDIDYDIGVACCSLDGTEGSRPNCIRGTYHEAVAHCSSKGMSLCTAQEVLKGITEDTGCNYNYAYQWTSDQCDDPIDIVSIDINAAASHQRGFTEATASDGGAGTFIPMILGAAIGTVAVAGVVALVVAKRKSAAKQTEAEMKDAVHVPDMSVSTATSKPVETGPAAELSVSTVPETTSGTDAV